MAVIALSIVVIIIFIVGSFISNNTQKTLLSLNVAPSIATINIDGSDYRNGVYEFKPGEYTATIRADGFEQKSITITVASGQTTTIFDYILNDEGLAYFEKEQADIDVLPFYHYDDNGALKYALCHNQYEAYFTLSIESSCDDKESIDEATSGAREFLEKFDISLKNAPIEVD